MKTKKMLPIILSALLLTACGSSYNSKSTAAYDGAMSNGAAMGVTSESYAADYDYDYTDEELKSFGTSIETGEQPAADYNKNNTDLKLDKEMLVYSCSLSVDVLDFENAVTSCKNYIDMYGGFIENENYSDGGSNSHWYYEDSEKWQTYTSTIRIPSSNYDAFCNATGELGNLRSKNASVENVTREYYDLSATLEIYEAKEERYIALLATVTEDEYAVAIERELTDIQIEIAKIKTRMNDIKTDVAYSYVYLTIKEVKEYVAEPVKTDTFLQRLGNTLTDSGKTFLEFLEGLLFVLIYLAPYLVIIAIIVVIIVKSCKASKKKKEKKREAEKAKAAELKAKAQAEAKENPEVNAETEPKPEAEAKPDSNDNSPESKYNLPK